LAESTEPVDRRVHREIRERIDELRPFVTEHQRLMRALEALEAMDGSAPPAPRPARRRSRPARRSGPKVPGARDAILKIVGERPGIGVDEIASATGADARTVKRLLTLAVKAGEGRSEPMPAGWDGYRTAGASTEATAEARDEAPAAGNDA
jgi:hypothetical protein